MIFTAWNLAIWVFLCFLVFLVAVADTLVTQIQLYGMDSVINGTVTYTAIREPTAAIDAGFSTLEKVGTLSLTTHPVAAFEGQEFSTMPQLQVLDSNVSETSLSILFYCNILRIINILMVEVWHQERKFVVKVEQKCLCQTFQILWLKKNKKA